MSPQNISIKWSILIVWRATGTFPTLNLYVSYTYMPMKILTIIPNIPICGEQKKNIRKRRQEYFPCTLLNIMHIFPSQKVDAVAPPLFELSYRIYLFWLQTFAWFSSNFAAAHPGECWKKKEIESRNELLISSSSARWCSVPLSGSCFVQ